jgi:protease PrsW
MDALLIASAIVPSALLLALFYFRDSFPEPPRVVLTTFVLGVLAVAPIWGFIELHTQLFGELDLDPYHQSLYRAYILAALPEEALKFAILMLFVRRHAAFDEPMDGLVYGAAASLGFATLENIMYVDAGGWATAITRATTAVPLHAALGALMGDYIAQAKFEPQRRKSMLLRAFVYPLLIHGMYNTPLLIIQTNVGQLSPLDVRLYVGFVYLLLGSLIAQVVWLNHRLRRVQATSEPGSR